MIDRISDSCVDCCQEMKSQFEPEHYSGCLDATNINCARKLLINIAGENFYQNIKHFGKKILCLVRGVKHSGVNVYISPRAIIKGPRKIYLRANVVVERDVALFADGTDSFIEIGAGTYLSYHCMLKASGGWIRIGNNCSINSFAALYGQGGLTVGDGVRIAAHAVIVPAQHIYKNPDMPICMQGETRKGIRIEDDVWIGAGVIILDGTTIGKGSVIGAGAVVTKDIPPYSIAVGVPAKVIKKRL